MAEAPPPAVPNNMAVLVEANATAPIPRGDVALGTFIVRSFERLPANARHPAGCACCAVRPPLAEALSALFLERVRGSISFAQVLIIASREGVEEARHILDSDAFLVARYRLDK